MTDTVIVAACRMAVGKFGGSLAKVPARELGAAVIADLLERTGVSGEQLCIGVGMGVALTIDR